ncbi:MAG: immunoglobulin domain-containing protein [Phycisphaerales bacterium]|nr:hypothetical protein [Planctomycetota bacterium]MCH8509273.1 immunoglobulin domain-containing protein [Phycisphaerales bacterium]
MSAGTVYALAVFDDGTGPALYAGGEFTVASGQVVNYIAKWDGSNWSPLTGSLGTGTNGRVKALTVFDDGTGAALYAGGVFALAGGQVVSRIAKWDGTDWSPLFGPSGTGLNGLVEALTVFDDGTGEGLYAGGLFTSAGGTTVNRIAKWDGTDWTPLTGPNGTGVNSQVLAMTVFDDGTGEALYVGGFFLAAGGQTVNRIAKWDGSNWSPLIGLGSTGVSDAVRTLTVFDNGASRALYAGGAFFLAGGQTVNRIAKWDGAAWSALTDSVGTGVNGLVEALTVLGNGTDAKLFVGGQFTTAAGQNANHIAAWRCTITCNPAPAIVVGPQDQVLQAGDTLILLTGTVGQQPLMHQWFHDGFVVMNDGRISGATTPTLIVTEVTPADSGVYELVVSDNCSDKVSASAVVAVEVPCHADLDDNGVLNFFDIAAFLAYYQIQDPIADWNGDGLFNFFDFAAYLDAFNAGCP